MVNLLLRYLRNRGLRVEFETKAAQQSEAQFKLQKLLFLVRNYSFEHEYGLDNCNKYLEEVLLPRSGRHQLTEIRSHLRSSFSNLCCFLMPLPESKITSTKKKFEAKNEESFEEENLAGKIAIDEILITMVICNHRLNSQAFAKTLYEIHYQTCVKNFTEGIEGILVSESYIDKRLLKDIHQVAMKSAMDSFDIALEVGFAEIRKKYRDDLTQFCEVQYDNMRKSNIRIHMAPFEIVDVALESDIVTMAGEPLEPFALMCLAPDSGVTFMERELQKYWCMVESKYCTSKTKEDKYRIVQMHKNDWENFAINDLNIPEKLIRKLKSKFGIGQTKMKLKMLLLWRNKHGQQGLPKEELVQCAEDFLNRKLNIDVTNQTFTDVCRLIVTAIPDEKWMRFARLELALTEKEISNVRAKYSEFTEEQKYQMLRLFLCGNEDFSGDSDDASQDSYIIGREY